MADLTITVPDAQVARILAALEETHGIETATAADVRAFLVLKLKQLVRASEQRVATKTAIDAVTDIDAT